DQGNFDHLLKYTQAETGAAFFAPSLNFLASLSDSNNALELGIEDVTLDF
ncbi:MAG: hypothetical protein ACI9C0_001371, partial [Alteromonadaceae bacterium]